MSKKVTISLILTLIIAMLTTSLVLAADPSASAVGRTGSRVGMVATVGKNQFTLKAASGGGKKVLVDSSTRFVKINGDKKGFSSLGVGQWVIAFGTLNDRKELVAKIVVLAGTRLNKGAWSGTRAYGRVVSVDEKANTFWVSTPNGLINLSVGTSTRYFGRVKNLHGLSAGMTAFLSYGRESTNARMVSALIAIP